MSNPEPREDLAPQLRTMQILWASLVVGVTMFLVVALVVRSGQGPILVQKRLLDFSDMLVLVGVLVAGMAVLMHYTIPALAVNSQRQALAEGRTDAIFKGREAPRSQDMALAAIYQTQMIIGLALLEGAAFLNAIVFMIQGSPVSLAVAVALIGLMATRVPTRGALDGWIEDQRARLRDESEAPRAD